jgi:hypothetical protein
MMRSTRSSLRAALAGAALALLLAATPAAAAITYRSSTTNTATATNSVVLSTPADVQVGDVMVASVVVGGPGGPGNTPGTLATPTGWTQAIAPKIQGGVEVGLYYRVVTGTEAATYTWSVASGSFTLAGGIVDYAGVNATPLDGTSSAGAKNGNAACTAFTTTTANDQIVVAAADNASVSWTPPAGMTERFDVGGVNGELEHSDVRQTTAGSTGTKTATPSSSTKAWACEMLALKPSAGTLSVSAPGAAPSFALTLNGLDQTTTYQPAVTVTDTRTVSSGWNLQITSTQFNDGSGHTLPTTASTVTGVTRACNTGSTCGTLPTNNVSYPFTIPAGAGPPAAVKLYNAAAGTGSGIVNVTPTVQVSVPGNAAAGSYSSDLTLTVASGP